MQDRAPMIAPDCISSTVRPDCPTVELSQNDAKEL
jgi:hypothetical protein